MIIRDMHCHVGYTSQMTRAGDADNLLDIQKKCGFESICVQTIVLWQPQNILRNLLAVQLKAENPDYCRIFGGVVYPQPGHPKPDLVTQAEKLVDAGFDGIKLFGKPTARKEYDLPFTHESYKELYAFCLAKDVPILFHIGDPGNFWDNKRCPPSAHQNGWFYGGEGFPSLERLFGEVEAFMSDFPQLKILFPHMLFMSDDLPRLDALLARFPRMRTDITPGTEMYWNMNMTRESARAFFVKNAGRVLFGTDNAGLTSDFASNTEGCLRKVRHMKRFLETEEPFIWGQTGVAGLALPEPVLNELYHAGFARFLGGKRSLAPAKVWALCEEWHQRAQEGDAKNLADFPGVLGRIKAALS